MEEMGSSRKQQSKNSQQQQLDDKEHEFLKSVDDTKTTYHDNLFHMEIVATELGTSPLPSVMKSKDGTFISNECAICGDKATGRHYGACSCDGCKGFFRRSVRKNQTYICRFANNCTIDKDKRNECRFCRLFKCFEAGMKREAVQNERDRITSCYGSGGGGRSMTSTINRFCKIDDITEQFERMVDVSGDTMAASSYSNYEHGVPWSGGEISDRDSNLASPSPTDRYPHISPLAYYNFESNKHVVGLSVNTLRNAQMASNALQKYKRLLVEAYDRGSTDVIQEEEIDTENENAGPQIILTDEDGEQASINDIGNSMKEQLLILVEWAKHIPAFHTLCLEDQVTLMRAHAGENLLLGVARRSMSVHNLLVLGNNKVIPNNLESKRLVKRTTELVVPTKKGRPAVQKEIVRNIGLRVMNELVRPFVSVQMDDTEFACVKAMVFFDPNAYGLKDVDSVKAIRHRIQMNLEEYMNERLAMGRFFNYSSSPPPLCTREGQEGLSPLTSNRVIPTQSTTANQAATDVQRTNTSRQVEDDTYIDDKSVVKKLEKTEMKKRTPRRSTTDSPMENLYQDIFQRLRQPIKYYTFGRFGEVLLIMNSLQSITWQMIEEMNEAKTSGWAQIDGLIEEMLLGDSSTATLEMGIKKISEKDWIARKSVLGPPKKQKFEIIEEHRESAPESRTLGDLNRGDRECRESCPVMERRRNSMSSIVTSLLKEQCDTDSLQAKVMRRRADSFVQVECSEFTERADSNIKRLENFNATTKGAVIIETPTTEIKDGTIEKRSSDEAAVVGENNEISTTNVEKECRNRHKSTSCLTQKDTIPYPNSYPGATTTAQNNDAYEFELTAELRDDIEFQQHPYRMIHTHEMNSNSFLIQSAYQ